VVASPEIQRDWDRWQRDVLRVLDSADGATFKSWNVPGFPAKPRIMNQIGALEEIVKQLERE
jgi:hypothetical protein